jgi:hypothetical protein
MAAVTFRQGLPRSDSLRRLCSLQSPCCWQLEEISSDLIKLLHLHAASTLQNLDTKETDHQPNHADKLRLRGGRAMQARPACQFHGQSQVPALHANC